MIVFNKPPRTGNEDQYVNQALASDKLSGDGFFGNKCHNWFMQTLGCHKALLTPSCTAALEVAAILIGIEPGDEVIMPSYTFVSTANAFVLRGARIVFVDIRPDTMNLNEQLIEAAVTQRTKAIVPVHYAGVPCDMDAIVAVAKRHSLYIVEDAAQGMMSHYKGRQLGTIGHLGTYSFHETKNFTSGGEGGLLIINSPELLERAEIIREKGTNRNQFFRGQVDKYTWVDIGSSYLPSELQAAYLWGQLEYADQIHQARLAKWHHYHQRLQPLRQAARVELPHVPEDCHHNGHMYYLKLRDLSERSAFIEKMRKQFDIMCVFHYIPLHTAPAGLLHGSFQGEDVFTTRESERLVRLPIWHQLADHQIDFICNAVEEVMESLG
jgi:dTDP-4-amino-4,6-dideoxygalactose transaminase